MFMTTRMRHASLVVVLCATHASAFAPSARCTGCAHSSLPRAPAVVAAEKDRKGSLDFSRTGSADKTGYRRGSFGIGEKESVVIWGVVAAFLVFGGSIDEETAQRIGEAQRSIYPKPPGLEKAAALKDQATRTAKDSTGSSAFPR